MLWIKDIKRDIGSIKSSPNELRKFGLLIGGVFLLVAVLAIWRHWSPAYLAFIPLILGIIIIAFGIYAPLKLKIPHRYWMAFAIIIGSFVSRIILFLLFYLVLTPLATIAKLFNRHYSYRYREKNLQSYWINRENRKEINYERMG